MMSLSHLALRYLLWLVGLRILYTIGIQVLGLPTSQATFVILAAVPAMDIGQQMVKRATRALFLKDWATAWGLMLAIYVAVNVIAPAIVLAPFRAALGNPAVLSQMGVILLATAAMLALFLFIGKIIARRSG